MTINEKQKRFCEEYLKDFNGAQAAIRAGYSKESAKEQASRLLTNANVATYLTLLKDQNSKNHSDLKNLIVEEYKKIGFSNIQDFIEADNSIVDISQIDREKAAVVESIKKTETEFSGANESTGTKTTVQIKLWDKLNALEKLGRYVGLFEEDNKQRGAIINVNIDD